VFCLLVVLIRLSVPVQVIRLERLVSEMTYNVLMGTLNPTQLLTQLSQLSSIWHNLLSISNIYILQTLQLLKMQHLK